MADSVITEPNGAAITLTGYQNIISKLTKQSKGLAAVSFDSYADGATAPSVVAGGIYEINGTYYEVYADTQITGMSSASTTYYIYSTSGTWSSSTTAPAWDEARNGWYLSTDANARCFFRVETDSGTEFDYREALTDKNVTRQSIKTIENVERIYGPTYGDVGSLVVAGSTSWSTNTEYLPGTTVNGNTLVTSNFTNVNTCGALSGLNYNIVGVDPSSQQTLSLTGTWVLLSRVYYGSSSGYIPLGLFSRTA